MAVKSGQVTVGTTAVELTGTDAVAGDGSSITVSPAADAFFGGSDVTAANGFKVPAGAAFSVDLQPGEKLFGIVASGTTTVYVLRGNV